MALFQSSVLKKYIKTQDKETVNKAFKKYTKYFHNPAIQQNIRQSKEEQFQEGFLRELFVNVLGYTLSPNLNFNLTTELKNEKGAKKADGAILKDGKALAVIELKSTDTKNLENIRQQAFDYKANQTGCIYVITSNFEKLRFYIDNAVEFEEFHLFTLNKDQFQLLYLCLQKNNLFNNTPLTIKNNSITEEESITKIFYSDYSLFKRELYRDLIKQNMQNDIFRSEIQKEDNDRANKNIKLSLFKKSQKLIDRFLFIFFSEDRGLLPPNSTLIILNDWKKLADLDAAIPLYDRFKLFFKYLDEGRNGTDKKSEIFAYNGGLFKPDAILNSLVLNDELLYKHTKKLSNYDFESQVDVNILGHIFENSLNEIESVNAEIEGTAFDKQKTKRKKDGVYYTPKYITQYIVGNTVGNLCSEKKQDLCIDEEEYQKSKKGRKKSTLQNLKNRLDAYREWLLTITICDPACGSGAFLNQSLDFLIKEHLYIDELEASLFGGGLIFRNIENTILENNIYGVDLNEESVEIAKLSLWLRTAQPRRKLSNLNNNIKCGNSLIDRKTSGGDNFFNWPTEFPNVFENGGFDVIIGNPPWGAKINGDIEKILLNKYPSVPSKLKDTYMYFQLLAIDVLKNNGILGLIVPNTWLLINNTAEFRKELLDYNVIEITDHGDGVFSDAIVESSTIILKKQKHQKENVLARKYRKGKEISNQHIDKNIWLHDDFNRIVLEIDIDIQNIVNRISIETQPFSTTSEIIFGIKPYQVGHGKPPQTQEDVDNRIFHSDIKTDNQWKPLVVGADINRYSCNFNNDKYIKYGVWLMYSSNEKKILAPKILLRRTSHDIKAAIDDSNYYPQNSIFIITSKLSLKYLLAILNSNLMRRIYINKCPQEGKVFSEIKPSIIKSLPIHPGNIESIKLIESLVDELIVNKESLNKIQSGLTKYLTSILSLKTLSTKLKNWPEIEYVDFMKEINKEIKKLGTTNISKSEEIEWMEIFDKKIVETKIIKENIKITDLKIDKLIYELYGITEEEINTLEAK